MLTRYQTLFGNAIVQETMFRLGANKEGKIGKPSRLLMLRYGHDLHTGLRAKYNPAL